MSEEVSPKPQKKLTFTRRRIILLALLILLAVCLIWGISWLLIRPTGQQHYLLLGTDNWGAIDEQPRSDAIMLVTLDFSRNKLLLTSFLRDSQVTLESGREDKLNTLTRTGGEDKLLDYLEHTYDIEIEGTITTNFTGMVQLIDAIGGITVELSPGEVREIKRNAGAYEGYPLHEGACRLNGAQALAYMRIRKIDNDMGRANRQANALKAVVAEAKKIGLTEAMAILPGVQDFYRTDMSFGQQAELLRDAYRLRSAPMERQQIPAEGTFRFGTLRGSSVLVMDEEKNQEAFWAFLGRTTPVKPEETPEK